MRLKEFAKAAAFAVDACRPAPSSPWFMAGNALKNTPRSLLNCLAGLLALCAPMVAVAGFYGTTFDAHYAYPTLQTSYDQSTPSLLSFVAGAGPEGQFLVEGVTTITVDFRDTSLSINFSTTLASPTWNVRPFNGLVFDVTGGSPLSFVGASIDPATTLAGFTAGRVGLSEGRLTLNWNGLSYADGTQVVVNFASAVPEPETYALFLAGLGAIGFVAWRRRPQG